VYKGDEFLGFSANNQLDLEIYFELKYGEADWN
jgi:hypothetical protein